eukprot:scaffold43968_cov61-Phaeocystis_antarctica.AAC.1
MWQSKKASGTCFFNDAMTGEPHVMLGTKWPSITSRCSSSAPAASTHLASLARLERSLASIDGAMTTHWQ